MAPAVTPERTQERRTQEGSAAVEFALVAPLLLLLVFGIISYGYMLNFRQNISQGAAEGARAAAVTPVGTSEAVRTSKAIAAVNEALRSYDLTCSSGGVVCRVTFGLCGSGATCARVTVSYPYRSGRVGPKFPGQSVVLPETLSYTATAEVSQ